MDLDDVLEDLLKGARRAVRDRRRDARGHRARRRSVDPTRAVRRVAPTLALIAGLWWLAVAGLSAVILVLVLDDGVGAALAIGALATLGLVPAGWGLRQRRARARMEAETRATRAATRRAEERAAAMPAAVRDDWRRLERARSLVGDLAADGWVSPEAVAELDGHVAHLRKLLAADHRTRELGGRPSHRAAEQVAELADLLVALADEAVEHQVELADGARAPATVAQARERMAVLRAARREVEDADRGPRGTTSTA